MNSILNADIACLDLLDAAEALSGAVAVGVDGSDESAVAADWAALRARELGCPLVVFQAHGPVSVSHADLALAPTLTEITRESARQDVAVVLAQLRQTHPETDLRGLIIRGSTRATLVAASRDAELLVLGSRGLGGLTAGIRGGVADRVVADACGDVVVVPASAAAAVARASETGGTAGMVVLGVDGDDIAAPALEVAAALARGGPGRLVAVHVVSDRAPWALTPGDERAAAAARMTKAREIAAALEPYGDGLEIDIDVVAGDVAEALCAAAADAALLVVGSRGRGSLAGILFGSTSRAVAQVAPCPVHVVAGSRGPARGPGIPRFVD